MTEASGAAVERVWTVIDGQSNFLIAKGKSSSSNPVRKAADDRTKIGAARKVHFDPVKTQNNIAESAGPIRRIKPSNCRAERQNLDPCAMAIAQLYGGNGNVEPPDRYRP